jgi:adenosylmethionine---8-amino-7-oxononanoate aminotransferase
MIWHPFTPQLGAPEPLKIVRASGVNIFDAQGKSYIDAIASWWTVIHGHNHPQIREAITRQLAALDHVMLAGFTHEPAEKLAAKLIEISGNKFSRVFYSDNGSTAVEVMLKLAIQYWKNLGEPERRLFIGFDSGYHGDTFGAMSVAGPSVFTAAYADHMFETVRFPYPRADASAEIVLTEIELFLQEHGERIAGIVIEPLIAAAGGMIFQSPALIARIAELAAESNVLLLCDEVFTGLGRTGQMFAYQTASFTPDMVALAKGLTGGTLPMAATLVSQKVHDAFLSADPQKTFFHGHTMCGNPPGCAAALASLDIFEQEASLSLVTSLAERARSHWLRLFARHGGKISVPRVLGAVSAVNLVAPPGTEGYTSTAGKAIARRCLDAGVIIRPLGDVLYLTPPYNIDELSLARVFAAIDDALLHHDPENIS